MYGWIRYSNPITSRRLNKWLWYVDIHIIILTPIYSCLYAVLQEHIVQWHPTILVKLALIPQKAINSYPTLPGQEGSYTEGDFVVHFQGCEAPERSCEREFERFWESRGRALKR